ncbi:putative Superoxide dismutase [Leptomonas seymouri]|uniref:superoxide dismutase n=1 Tax=Leptomonas seymouri TaxID=5684 RepID=A0A0N0P4B5_LEPSE|nr:putative Superoxide dismutase [Leptomonas seymouri]|eukprot:KPI85099.1 putative Superoxide dismutase [Leptomonas seymouri]
MRPSIMFRFAEYVPKWALAQVNAFPASAYAVTSAFRATEAAAMVADVERNKKGFFYLPRLDYDVDQGVAPLMSKKQFDVQYHVFHKAAVDRLNAHTLGSELEGHSLNVVIRNSSFDASRAVIHAAASEHFNYCFWYRSLRPWGTAVPSRLKEELQLQYSENGILDAVEEVKRRFVVAALSQQPCCGWVYLVWTGKMFDVLAFDHGTCPVGGDVIPLLGLNIHESAMCFDYPSSDMREMMERYVHNFFKTCNWGLSEQYFLQARQV